MLTLIIDGNNLAHRAKHVFSLSNAGKNVSVTYGFLHTLQAYIIKFKPDSVVVCWDGGVPSFRTTAVPSYKANREHGDEVEYADFLRQVQELCDYAFPMMGIVSVRKTGAEADDLMYHASRMLTSNNIIITSDKDLLQAINDNTNVYNPARDTLYDRETFEKEFGILHKHFVYWKAMIGDGSDNIPGMRGIGEKTATKLLNAYGDITNVVNAALGHNPDKNLVMSDKIKTAVLEFGFDKIVKNVYIMALYADRVGSRMAVSEACDRYAEADKARVKKYLMRNAFISLMDSLPHQLSKLKRPVLMDLEKLRVPVICSTRRPLI